MSIPSLLLVQPGLCTACRSCEVACHYHHTRRFGAGRNSVHISYHGDTSDLEIAFDESCDVCLGEERPLCAEFCVPGAIRVQLVEGAR